MSNPNTGPDGTATDETEQEVTPCSVHRCLVCREVFRHARNGSSCPDCGAPAICSADWTSPEVCR